MLLRACGAVFPELMVSRWNVPDPLWPVEGGGESDKKILQEDRGMHFVKS